jgi:hypothetical protein
MEPAWDYFKDRMHLYEDGEETVFNMVNSMLGVMYLSGHIEYADSKNSALIKEGIEVYKATRDEFRYGYPAFVTEPFGIMDKLFAAYGLQTESSMLLAVWKIDAEGDEAAFDLSSYVGCGAKVKLLYPSAPATQYSFDGKTLRVRMEKQYMARLFLVEK